MKGLRQKQNSGIFGVRILSEAEAQESRVQSAKNPTIVSGEREIYNTCILSSEVQSSERTSGSKSACFYPLITRGI